ncbi:MAG: 4-alpha-glucanotransferase, partial [Oscillospiraceae bacterium]|nr:4-alpha-glucanotransferase [Oscillospiraceae bacterium]
MRSSGILMHISSLPSKYGIGTLGKAAYDFVDFLNKSKQKYWQILPVNPTSFGDSPYQSPSAFAGNPYFIDPDILCEEGLIHRHEIDNYFFGDDDTTIDYARLFEARYPMLRIAFGRYNKDNDFYAFVDENRAWLDDYALYMSLKETFHYIEWTKWERGIRMCEQWAIDKYRGEQYRNIEFYQFIQYMFFKQWNKLKKYANEKGVEIIGDMPIYVALDSAEVWKSGRYFMLDGEKLPTKVAGCPPDAFAEKGQLWGNPIYNWDEMERDGYRWWIERIKHSLKMFDMVRIDHFRGFESYYTIKYGDKDAVKGNWEKGPGMKLFNAIRNALGDVRIIAEDLGFLTPEVYKLLADCGYPGMKVMQFAFDPNGDSEYLPHNYGKNCIAYTGTHDNDTMYGWIKGVSKAEKEFALKYVDTRNMKDFADKSIKSLMRSAADTVIVPIQDYLNIGTEGRMNVPSVVGGNWMFRITADMLDEKKAEYIADMT